MEPLGRLDRPCESLRCSGLAHCALLMQLPQRPAGLVTLADGSTYVYCERVVHSVVNQADGCHKRSGGGGAMGTESELQLSGQWSEVVYKCVWR